MMASTDVFMIGYSSSVISLDLNEVEVTTDHAIIVLEDLPGLLKVLFSQSEVGSDTLGRIEVSLCLILFFLEAPCQISFLYWDLARHTGIVCSLL